MMLMASTWPLVCGWKSVAWAAADASAAAGSGVQSFRWNQNHLQRRLSAQKGGLLRGRQCGRSVALGECQWAVTSLLELSIVTLDSEFRYCRRECWCESSDKFDLESALGRGSCAGTCMAVK